jgi:hypothetical protein
MVEKTRQCNNVCFFFQKLRVWCSVSDGKWELGQVQSISGDDVEILLVNGEVSFMLF